MKLHEFLSLITDEEARIELEIDNGDEPDYSYESFWLSDYRVNKTNREYSNYEVTGFRFMTEFSRSDITIEIKKL